MSIHRTIFSVVGILALGCASAGAQQLQGTPGAPGTLEFPDSRVLPTPTSPFTGVINPNLIDSQPSWPSTVAPPKDAPNVLLILIDDAGYGSNSVFGGVVPTPTLEKLAQRGLRYTQMHNTALCSPTRAALLTGRNHHAVAFGDVAEGAVGYPGYDTVTGPDTRSASRPCSRKPTSNCRQSSRTSWGLVVGAS
jgi:arylsulfatase